MIAYLSGDIREITFDSITIDVNGVGYFVSVGKPQDFSYGPNLVYIYYQQKEDGVFLYGFKTKKEKELFLRLIDVNGIGPKTASVILGATTTSNLINAIESGNVAFLKKLPSIGAKAAQQIVLDLKGKLVIDEKVENKNNQVIYEDIYTALRSFGFRVSDIDAAINSVKNIATLSPEAIIKECLKFLRK